MLNAQRMIRINLVPAVEHAESRVKMPSISSVVPLIVLGSVVGVLAIVSIVQSVRIRSLNGQIQALEAEARELAPLIRRVDELTRERELSLKRLDVIERLDRDRLVRVRLVDELARRIPEYIWFSGFSERGGAITINGAAFSNLTVADLIRSLERSVLYEQVDLTIAQRGEIEGHDVVNFTLTARRQTQPDPAPVEPAVHEIQPAPGPAPAAGPGA
jgi:Tfp pilus assembly protein PilN